MLTITTGLTGKVWQGLNGRRSVSRRGAFVFCDLHRGRLTKSTPHEALDPAVCCAPPLAAASSFADGSFMEWRAGARRIAREDFR